MLTRLPYVSNANTSIQRSVLSPQWDFQLKKCKPLKFMFVELFCNQVYVCKPADFLKPFHEKIKYGISYKCSCWNPMEILDKIWMRCSTHGHTIKIKFTIKKSKCWHPECATSRIPI